MHLKKLAALTAAASGLVVGGAGAAMADSASTASGTVTDSPGIIAGNNIQLPVDIPITLTGNQVDILSSLDSLSGITSTS